MAGLNNDQAPFPITTRLGPAYVQLVPGPPGPIGPSGGVITTTSNFTQPAVGSSVSASVTTTAGLAPGLDVFVQGGGYYQVVSTGGGPSVTLLNLGTPGININPSLTVNSGSILSPSGPPALVSPAHSVVIGEGSSPLAGVGPATLGLAFIAQGPSNDPAFGVLGVAGGGTGLSTVGSNGQVLTLVSGAPAWANNTSILTPLRLSSTTTLSNGPFAINVYANTTTAAFTITMPPTPIDGQPVIFYDDHGKWSTNGLTVAANTGQTILDVQNPIPTFGASTTLIQRYSSIRFEFDGTLNQWHT